jgi:hypothetical protein
MLECSRYVRKELVKLDDDANQKQLEAQGWSLTTKGKVWYDEV